MTDGEPRRGMVERIASLSPDERAALERRFRTTGRSSGSLEPLKPRDGGEPVSLSFAQERLWFLNQLEPDSVAYHVARGIRLRGRLDLPALERAFQEVVDRHETLRTTFAGRDGVPVQEIAPSRRVDLPLLDLSTRPQPEREQETARILAAEVRRPFDLTRDPVVRPLVVRHQPDEHVLSLVMHHVASDWWSAGILFRELAACYDAATRGGNAALPELPIQYADFALWQRRHLQGPRLDSLLGYWRRALAGAPPLLELPTDHARPAVQTDRGARQPWSVPAPIGEGLRQLARREGLTPFMALLAAFQTLLHRYVGHADIVVGSPVAGRTRREIEPLIGFFVNMLVLRTDLSGNPSFRELAARVKEVCLAAYDHQELPFERLVEALDPARSLSYSPVFQVMLNFHARSAPPPFRDLEVSEIPTYAGTAQFDLTLAAWDAVPGLAGVLEYSTDLFGAETMARMAAHFQTLLAGIVADPDRPIGMLPLLADGERQRLLSTWNATTREWPSSETCVHHLVEAQVARTPDAPAVSFEGQALSYRELDARATQLARILEGLGVGPDVPVGLCVGRSLDMVIGVLAVLKAGGAYLPLDPTYPDDRLRFILDDARVGVLLTHEAIAPRVRAHAEHVLCLDAEWPAAAKGTPPTAKTPLTPESLAYVIYTSGSTGRPKGVEVPHRAVVNILRAFGEPPGVSPDDTWLAVTTLAFDIATLELVLPLTAGARVVIAPGDATRDGAALAALLRGSGATIMQATPATWRLLLEAGWAASPGFTMLCGGEVLPRDLATALLAGEGRLWNLYGPTETTIWSAMEPVTPGTGAVPIGRPLPNTRFYVLDDHQEPVPVGVPGELYIGGRGVARGYHRRPELTAERFVADPFGPDPGARLYRTGDHVRYRASGDLLFLGRGDHQVKLRGFRVELGEIEAVLGEQPGVQSCAVVVHADGAGGEGRLVAYVVPAGGPATPSWQEALRARLPAYMVPTAFVMLDALPLTPNGKLDRRGLPASDSVTLPPDSEALRSPMEQALAAIWTEVLGVERIGRHDRFFDLGGHSLLSMRVIARVEARHGVRLTPRDFLLQDLGQLAAVCDARPRSAPVPTAAPRLGRRLAAHLGGLFRRRPRT